MICGIVGTEDSAVLIMVQLCCFFYYSNIIIFLNQNCNSIFLTWFDKICYIKFPPDKSSFNVSGLFPVHKYVGFPVYSIEIQEYTFIFKT